MCPKKVCAHLTPRDMGCCSDKGNTVAAVGLEMGSVLSLSRGSAAYAYAKQRAAHKQSQALKDPPVHTVLANPVWRFDGDRALLVLLYSSVATTPAKPGVYLTMKALLQPGDKVVAIFPAYQSLHELAESTGCSVRYWEPQLPTGSGQVEFRVQDVLVCTVCTATTLLLVLHSLAFRACLATTNIVLPGTSARRACCLRQTISCRLAMPAYAHA